MKSLILLLAVLFPVVLCAQFTGGSGDGYDKSVTSGSLGAMLLLYGGVFDISGRLLLSESYLAGEVQTQSVELQQQLPAGTYLIRLTHPKKGQQAKILIVGESGR